jgi:hypothetical protein
VSANPLRGEVALALPEGPLLLRPSFAALVAAEAELGSLFGVLERAGRGDIRLADMAVLFWHCAGAAAGPRDEFETALMGVGPSKLLAPYRSLLSAIFGG